VANTAAKTAATPQFVCVSEHTSRARLFGNLGPREEPITYWFTVGDRAVLGSTQKRLVELRYGLTGRIPDGLLFRVSSLDGDAIRAYEIQGQFANQLLQSVSPADRIRLSGLGGS